MIILLASDELRIVKKNSKDSGIYEGLDGIFRIEKTSKVSEQMQILGQKIKNREKQTNKTENKD